ncbi:Crp/Fnr family transcriptional regulator [uncultured Chitinophaga sp.]|uniref:Crp/Fnr family transcriptional regulator n=1 Tax=uncultured Chitinophaga sp. TaxID=339340 RepID=UPI0026069876|nr:Crp/Fnr family transcriptional regulator [uncultured Chitinophaga sp.]
MKQQLISFLQLFSTIPAADRELIGAAFHPLTLKEGDYVQRGGQVCRQLFFICSGVLRIVMVNDKGAEVTHYFLKQNQFCTILNSFNTETVADESIQAACNATVLAITRADLLALYEQLPYVQTLINQVIQQGLLDKIRIRNTYLGQEAATRYKLFLMQQPDIAMQVSLSDIASYLGITPQSLSRIRKNFR